MIIRPQAPNNAPPIILHSINRVRYKSSQASVPHSRLSNVPRKFSPRVNKSFTCYQEIPSSTPKNRSLSVEKYKNSSTAEISPKARHKSTGFRTRNLRSSSKLINGHPAPGDLEETKEIKFKKEMIASWMERGLSEMKIGQYSSAIGFLSKVVKEQPNHIDALFHRACCLMNMNDHKQAIPDLLVICQDSPLYDKKLYIALAMCFANLNDFDTAIRQLSKGLLKFPKFAEGYVTRGQLFGQQMKWEKATQDFYKAISLNPAEGSAYLGLGDSFMGMNDTKNALKLYNQAIQYASTCFQGLVRRAKLFFDLQDYEKCLKDLELALSHNPEDAEVYYYKALILLSQDNLPEAALCLEQVIKFDSGEKKYTGAAIYDLGAIKIKQKDYYGAMYTFKRATDINLEVKEQKVLKGYVEAILSLMKRKFKEGISLLNTIIKKKNPLIQEYVGNCYCFRGYGYASIEKHEQAVRNLNSASKIQALDNASKYNLQVSTAIIKADKEPNDALALLEEASKDFPKNIEPLAYQAAIYLLQARKSSNKKIAEKSKFLLDKAISQRETDSDLYFFRGLVLYYLGKPIEAVPEFEVAIDKAEDNMPIHFMARGLCYAQLKLLKEAIQDFSISIQLDEKLSEAYYYRGRCAYLLDDSQLAFQDFQKMITNKHEDPIVHAGNLLMLAGSIEDARKAFTNANSIKPTPEAFIQRAKCFLMLEKPDQTLQDLESALQLGPSKEIEFDIEILKILTSSIDNSDLKSYLLKKISQLSKVLQSHTEGKIFRVKHIHWYKGCFYFFLNEYQKAKVELKAALDTKTNTEEANTEKDNSEVLYNLALCYILSEQYEAALIHLQELVYVLEGNDRGKVLLIIGIINLALKDNQTAKSVMLEAFKYESASSTAYLEEKPNVEVLPFFSSSSLASKFGLKELKVFECHPVYVRPSFNYPYIQQPTMEFGTEDFVLDKFSVRSVKCKPEAPWLNRVKGTIQFTEEIRDIVSESVASTTKSDSEDESNSIFDSSFSDAKTFRSAVVMPTKEHIKHDTANLFNFIKKEKDSKDSVLEASEEVKKKFESIFFNTSERNQN
jgi:tetratricopeptide (TPR) repeat protein